MGIENVLGVIIWEAWDPDNNLKDNGLGFSLVIYNDDFQFDHYLESQFQGNC